jgi:hypothetical protein
MADLTDSDDDTAADKGAAPSHFQYVNFMTCEATTGVAAMNYMFKQSTTTDLDLRKVILLDSQSTIDVFCNRKLLTNIHRSPTPIRLQSNGGTMELRYQGRVAGYHLDVWYNKHALTNIVAFKNLIDLYDITYSRPDRSFYVHRTEHGLPDMQFKMHSSGLHYYDPEHHSTFQFVTTVSGNKAHFTDCQVKGADKARKYYRTLGYPSVTDFRWVVQSNLIQNCPVTVQDIDVALEIWGPDVAALKGKTSRGKSPIVAPDFVKVPPDILSAHRDVCLAADIFFVNKIPFFLTVSRNRSLLHHRDASERQKA